MGRSGTNLNNGVSVVPLRVTSRITRHSISGHCASHSRARGGCIGSGDGGHGRHCCPHPEKRSCDNFVVEHISCVIRDGLNKYATGGDHLRSSGGQGSFGTVPPDLAEERLRMLACHEAVMGRRLIRRHISSARFLKHAGEHRSPVVIA